MSMHTVHNQEESQAGLVCSTPAVNDPDSINSATINAVSSSDPMTGVPTTSQYRKLGRTGFDISTIGFGTWQLGGTRWRGLSNSEAIDLLRYSLNSGINIYDTAVVYGQYTNAMGTLECRTQELLGQAFSRHRDHVFYCVKLGQYDELTHRANYTPDRIIDQFKHALRRLQSDYIDVALIHAPSLSEVESMLPITILQTLRSMGLVRAIGYSFENEPRHVLEAIKHDIDVLMVQLNLIDVECQEVLQAAHEKGIGILVGGPLKRGLLSGQYTCIEDIPSQDEYWRWNLSRNPNKINHLLSVVQDLSQKYGHGEDLRTAALHFILKERAVSSAIVGMRSTKEVSTNIMCANNLPTAFPV